MTHEKNVQSLKAREQNLYCMSDQSKSILNRETEELNWRKIMKRKQETTVSSISLYHLGAN